MGVRIPNSQFLIPNFAVLLALTACRAPAPASEHSAAALESLTLTHAKTSKAVVGAEIHATADGLPPDRTVDLIWETVDGGWVVEDGYRFRGKRFIDSTRALGRTQVGSDGR